MGETGMAAGFFARSMLTMKDLAEEIERNGSYENKRV